MRALISIFLFSFSFLFSTNYYVEMTGTDNATCSQSNPCEHIQTAINLTSNGDVVIVSGGTYLENLLIETGITLKSEDETDPAIIDGSSPETDPALWNGGSCIVIRTPSGASSRVTATVQDITMTGGKGTDIIEDSNHNGSFSDPDDEIKKVGGGMIVHKAGLLSRGNKIINNGDSSTKEGGAVYAAGTGADIPDDQPADPPDDHFPNERLVIEFEETIFSGNNAQIGHTVMVNGWDMENQFIDMDFGNSQFDCAFDSDNNELDFVTEYWVKGKDNSTFDFTGGITGDYDAIITDVWVNPDTLIGVDEGNTLGNQNYPFLTIDYAMSMIYPTEDNPITIHLTAGEFSPSNNNEVFQINMFSNVNLIGQGEAVTILDAEETDRVIIMEYCQNNIISDLTITGGYLEPTVAWDEASGGGVLVKYSNFSLNHVTISGNTSKSGGGIYLNGSDCLLTYVTLSENTVSSSGGGIYMFGSNPILKYSMISGNIAGSYGGGISMWSSNSTLNYVIITENISHSAGGGVYVNGGDPTLNRVIINGNSAIPHEYISAASGGGISLFNSDPIMNNVTLSGNLADYGGGIELNGSNPTLTHVTIAENIATGGSGGGMWLVWSDPSLVNTIIWHNSQSIYIAASGTPLITYSDIEGGWEGATNIDEDPMFIYQENGDLSLNSGSPCIDSGNPFIWDNDLDGSRSDMGVTGGLYASPNFINHDFGEVGNFGSDKQFELYNYRETAIIIDDISFQTSSFTSNTIFPLTIEPFEIGIININANNSFSGFVEDNMVLLSEDLPEGISISLSVTGINGITLSGNLSGTYQSAVYRITGDLTIASSDSVILEPGTEFLFDGEYNFNIYGTLKAIGTESDSIIFDNYGTQRWRGFTLENVGEEVVFEYIRASGATKDTGGMYLFNSDPIVSHMLISENIGSMSGGMYLIGSNPNLTHVILSGNYGGAYGGGIHINGSNPTLTHVTIIENISAKGGGVYSHNYSNAILTDVMISGNLADKGGGIYLQDSDPILTHVTITNNIATYNCSDIYDCEIFDGGSGGGMYLDRSDPILTHVTIKENKVGESGGGMYLKYSNPTLTYVTIRGNLATVEYQNNLPPSFIEDCFGGGMYLYLSIPILIHVEITNNTATLYGGGIYFEYMGVSHPTPILTYVTISGNMAYESAFFDEPSGGGIYSYNDLTVVNSIIWGNSPELFIATNHSIIINYSDIEGGWEGEGNIDLDPLFNGDFTLQSTSPCIDAGTAYFEWEGEIIVDMPDSSYYGLAPDMGAYEFEGSSAAGDLNSDGLINVLDVVVLVNIVLGYGEIIDAGDMNGDGVLNVLDVVALVSIILEG